MSYTVIQQDDAQRVHIQFDGPFRGKTVTWDTHFYTLESYISLNNDNNIADKQFIDIEPIDESNFKLTIALKIPEINHQNIKKMMIMVKQYKNLSLGRHEYG